MIIAGLGGLRNAPACAVLRDGQIVSAVEQNKVARGVTPGALPFEAIKMALELAGAASNAVDCAAIVRPFEPAAQIELRSLFPRARLVMVEHHAAHAASAYYPSPFTEATVLTLDRDGDFRSCARWAATDSTLRLEQDAYYPDSLGDLYGRVTELLGFHAGADEHKVQWLSTLAAADRFEPLFTALIGGAWPSFDRSYIDTGRTAFGGFSAKFYNEAGLEDGAPVPEETRPFIAAGLQAAIEKSVTAMAADAENVCLAGGLAFNALLVSALERTHNVFAQTAAGNAGTALGAALHTWHAICGQAARGPFDSVYLGPSYTAEQIKRVLENCKLRFRYLMTTGELVDSAVRLLNDQKIIAWMQGRMEFGPRALGNRSILASPLNPYSTENLNVFIKHREAFRKFAASVPVEAADEYFECGPNARFLASVSRVRPQHRKTFESAVLGNGLVRVHTVAREENALYHRLLLAAGKTTGLPVLYNTSFNLFGDPMVCTPRDAVRSFYSSGIDALFTGHFLLEK